MKRVFLLLLAVSLMLLAGCVPKDEYAALEAKYNALNADYEALNGECEALTAENGALSAENDALNVANEALSAENDSLAAARDELEAALEDAENYGATCEIMLKIVVAGFLGYDLSDEVYYEEMEALGLSREEYERQSEILSERMAAWRARFE